VAALDKLCGEDEVLDDGSLLDEAGLVCVHELGDLQMQSRG
jgi:hypothetical protein